MTVKSTGKGDNLKSLKQTYTKEFNFISDILSNVDLPCQELDSDSEDENKPKKVEVVQAKKTTERAKTLEELHKRLEALREQKYTYKGKKLKNKLQSKLKRKKKIYESKIKRNALVKETRNRSETDGKKTDIKPPKPIFNSEGNLVFSKFDFLGETSAVNDKETLKKDVGNKKQILEKLEKQKTFIKKLEEKGEVEKASKIKEETAWNNALKKAEGVKVKDDTLLLKKSLAKKKARKKVSEKKWKERIENVEKQKEDKQKKRTDNLMKRKQEMKKKKTKKAIKKGRFVPNL